MEERQDLISRQTAIDAMKDMYRAAEKWLRDATDDVTKARAESCMASLVEIKLRTEKLPVAQPATNCSEIPNRSDDTISKQAAVDVVDFECGEWRGLAKTIIKKLEALPAAQPERTCVNCGRTANNGGWYADGRTRCPIEEHYALPKDGYCHLWEKRNVTDDDYPERRTDGEIIPE